MANIRWTKGQKSKLKKAVDTFRKKVERYSKTDIAEALPAVPKIRELKKQIGTAKELNDLVKDLQAFSKGANKGKPQIYINPQGVKMTEWERQRVNKAIAKVNLHKKERVEKIESQEIYDAEGNLLPDVKRVAKKYEEIQIKKRPEKAKTSKEWKAFSKQMQELMSSNYENKRLETMQKNIITALKTFWGKEGAMYSEIVKRMSIDQVKKAYDQDGDTFSPEFMYKRDVYDSSRKADEETAQQKLEKLLYQFTDNKMSREIINDKINNMNQKNKAVQKIKKAINNIDDVTLNSDLKAYYDILNSRVKHEKKLQILMEMDLI